MNNTLTGLGLALVLALLAALIGPWFINWSAYREDFAKQASALIGAPVSVTGAIEARLLPSPYVLVRGLTAGTGARALSVDEVEVTLAIAPLLRGEFKAERVKLVRPRVGIEVGTDGEVRTAFSGARNAAPDAVSFDRAEIADGTLSATSPAGVVVADRIDGVAEAGSLAGPYRFEGELSAFGARTEARLSTARLDDRGAVRLKLALKRKGGAETLDIDGALTVAARPNFAGRATLARASSRKAGEGDAFEGQALRLASDLKADAGRVEATALELVYGPEDRGVRLGGRGELKFGAAPRFDLAIETRQLDLDRMAGDKRPRTPSDLIATIFAKTGAPVRPAIPGRLALDVKGVVLAGDVIQGFSAELETERNGLRVRRAKAQLPAGTAVSANGALSFADGAPGFAGDMDFATSDLAGFRRWLAGGADVVSPVRSLGVKGRIAAGTTAISIEDATLDTDGARSTGRVAWNAGREGGRGRLEAALSSEQLDLDALGLDGLLKQAFAGGALDAAVALDAKKLTLAGVSMSGVSIDGTADAGGVDLKRLDIRDAGGASLSGAGRMSYGAAGPSGHVSVDLAAARLTTLVKLARALGAPGAALEAVEAREAALAPIKLQIDVDAGGSKQTVTARGDAVGGRLDLRLAAGELSLDAPADIEIKATSADGRRLAALVGLAVSPVASADGGEIALKLSGAPSKGMTGEGRFAALGVDLRGRGAVAVAPLVGLSAEGTVTLESADLSSIGEALGRFPPGASPKLPAKLSGKAALGPEEIRIETLDGSVAGVAMRGRLTAPREPGRPIAGALAFDELPTKAIAALALSPAGAGEERSVWSSAPFGPGLARGLTGRIEMSAARAPFAGRTATDTRFTLALRPSGIGVESFAASLDKGRLEGSMTIARSGDDATVSLNGAVRGVDVETLTGVLPQRSAFAGTAELKVEAQGTGRSPASLVGALTGAGSLALRDVRIKRLDVGAIDRVEPKVEAGLALDAPKVAAAIEKDLGGADMAFGEVVAPFTLSGGIARTGAFTAVNDAARLGGAAALDLRRMTLDADLTLQPNRAESPQIAVSFEGPIASPARRIDATALTSWLSVRAVERETKRIEAMEADIQERARVARLRAEEERRKAEEEKKRLDEERRKAEAERRKREAEARALIETLPRPTPSAAPGLPPALDLSPPGLAPNAPHRPATPPTGVFGGPEGRLGGGRTPSPDALSMPQSILPPAAVSPGR